MNPDVALLERAAGYALWAADGATPDLWSRPTPCSRWDLRMLLMHACESVAALQEGLACGRVALCSGGAAVDEVVNPADVFRSRVSMLVDAWRPSDTKQTVAIADRDVTVSTMTGVAAIEIAVHGWDIAQSSNCARPIPAPLAADLLVIARHLLADGNRRSLFDPPLTSPGRAEPSDVLLAFLGRQPRPSVSLW